MAGLLFGLGAILFAIINMRYLAACALIGAGVADLFDGVVARHMSLDKEERLFGAELDTVADMSAFGVAPAVLLFSLGLRSPAEVAIIALFVMAAAWRLAYFGAFGMLETPSAAYYIGLPVTYVALVLPLTLLVDLVAPGVTRSLLTAVTLALAMLMVSRLAIRKPGGICYPIFAVSGIVVASLYLWAHFSRSS